MAKPGKGADKNLEPIFPRLHVSNAGNKSGPRAPPRNKMALYEQLSTFHKFNHSGKELPQLLNHSSNGNGIPSTSTSQGSGCLERNLFPVFSPASVEEDHHPFQKFNVPYLGRGTTNSTGTDLGRQTSYLSDKGKSIFMRMEPAAQSIGTRKEGNTVEQVIRHSPRRTEDTGKRKLSDEYDCMVPRVLSLGTSSLLAKALAAEQEKLVACRGTSTTKSCLPTPRSPPTYLNSNERLSEDSQGYESRPGDSHVVNGIGQPETPRKPQKEKGCASIANFEDKFGKPEKFTTAEAYPIAGDACNAKLNTRKGLIIGKTRDSWDLNEMNYPRFEISTRTDVASPQQNYHVDKENISGDVSMFDKKLKVEIAGTESRENSDGVPKECFIYSRLESTSGLKISPDDVVSLIGPKHFWKARRAIINQQRVLSMQVMELHRLINVQKLIARSPHLFLSQSDDHMPDVPAHIPEPLPAKDGTNDEVQGPSAEHLLQVGQEKSSCEEDPVVPVEAPLLGNKAASVWCLEAPWYQWLVPVMSPTEGLVFKPFSGTCPAPSAVGELMSKVYNASAQNMSFPALGGHPFISPFGFPMPMMTPAASTSSVEQVMGSGVSTRFGGIGESGSSASGPSRMDEPAVIRVVPHKMQAAVSESAVRIFQSIQKERQRWRRKLSIT